MKYNINFCTIVSLDNTVEYDFLWKLASLPFFFPSSSSIVTLQLTCAPPPTHPPPSIRQVKVLIWLIGMDVYCCFGNQHGQGVTAWRRLVMFVVYMSISNLLTVQVFREPGVSWYWTRLLIINSATSCLCQSTTATACLNVLFILSSTSQSPLHVWAPLSQCSLHFWAWSSHSVWV